MKEMSLLKYRQKGIDEKFDLFYSRCKVSLNYYYAVWVYICDVHFGYNIQHGVCLRYVCNYASIGCLVVYY